MDQLKQEKDKKFILFSLIFLVIIETIIVLGRAFYGTEVTDEAFYLSTANQILQGRVPIVNIWFIGSGSALSYAWIIKLYKIFVPDLDGVFLFTRIVFHIMRMAILLYGFFVIKKKSGIVRSILIIGMLIPFYTLIENFSYNSVPIYLMLLVGFLLLDELSCNYKYSIRSLVAGVLVALVVYSHPCEIINIFLVGAGIIFLSRQKVKNICMYICGGVGTGIAIVIWTLNRCGGWNKCIIGIKLMVRYCTTVYGPKAIRFYIKDACLYILPELFYLLLFIFFAFIAAKIYISTKKIKDRLLIQGYFILMSIILWFIFITLRNAVDTGFPFYTKFGTISMLASIAVFIVARKDSLNWIIFTSLSLPHIIFCITNGLLAGDGIVGRMYTMIPCLVPFLFIMTRELQLIGLDIKKLLRVEFAIFFIASVVLLRFDFSYVYRDSSIPNLTTKIDSGLYTGLYTTEQNAKSLILLQRIVEENVDREEHIVVMDCTPSVYMMSETISSAPITWDITRFNNARDDSEEVIHFFEFMEDIPDKILYVANPYKPKLSIDDPDFSFNDFVHENYHLIKQENINDIYDVRIYEINQNNNF